MRGLLTAEWLLRRVLGSFGLPIVALFVTGAALVAITQEIAAVEALAQKQLVAAKLTTDDRAASQARTALTLWRARLTEQSAIFPSRREATQTARAASALLEKSELSVEAIGISDLANYSADYGAVSLEIRMTGSAARALPALSNILATSPGWLMERVSVERQASGTDAIEALLIVVYRSGS
jgi:hypothetical protein